MLSNLYYNKVLTQGNIFAYGNQFCGIYKIDNYNKVNFMTIKTIAKSSRLLVFSYIKRKLCLHSSG